MDGQALSQYVNAISLTVDGSFESLNLTVNDFGSAQSALLNIGYHVFIIYPTRVLSKWREYLDVTNTVCYNECMFTRLRSIFSLRVGLAIAMTLIVVGMSVPTTVATAATMNHRHAPNQDCLAGCTGGYGLNTTNLIATTHNENDDLPTPPSATPYYIQFPNISYAQPFHPKDRLTQTSYRPPDIVQLYANYRI